MPQYLCLNAFEIYPSHACSSPLEASRAMEKAVPGLNVRSVILVEDIYAAAICVEADSPSQAREKVWELWQEAVRAAHELRFTDYGHRVSISSGPRSFRIVEIPAEVAAQV